eukprot:s427_g12.t1
MMIIERDDYEDTDTNDVAVVDDDDDDDTADDCAVLKSTLVRAMVSFPVSPGPAGPCGSGSRCMTTQAPPRDLLCGSGSTGEKNGREMPGMLDSC